MTKYETLTATCEELIRAGRAAEAAAQLQGLNAAQVPRKWRLPLANICRRANLVPLGLRLLAPIMNFDKKENVAPASVREQAEYAVLLERFGAVAESLRMLKLLDASLAPEIYLFRAFCLFKTWDYEEAIPELELYVAADLAPYQRLVGKMNLAAANNNVDRLAPAARLLAEIIEACRQGNHNRLLANALELMAEVQIKNGELSDAGKNLAEASVLMSEAGTQDRLFVRISQAYIEGLETGSPRALQTLKTEAAALNHFESAREIDLLLLKLEFNKESFHRLCAGTPFKGFHARVERFLGRAPELGEFTLGSGPALPQDLTPGSQPHRVLSILLKDLYKPVPTGALFAELFPEEHFNIESSPNRVRQLVHRLARWGRDHGLPFEIRHTGAGYKFDANGMAVKLGDKRAPDVTELQLEVIKAKLDEFSFQEAVEVSGNSAATVRRAINRGLERGLLRKFGASTRTRYYFAS